MFVGTNIGPRTKRAKEDLGHHQFTQRFTQRLLRVVGCMVVLWCCWVSVSQVRAEGTTALGGALLDRGEVAISAAVGFPDVMAQFDFAQSRIINLALRARLNYNFGFPFFGLNAFVSAPLRIGLLQQVSSQLKVALMLEPGVYLGGGALYGFHFGVLLGIGGLVSYQVLPKLNLYGGLEIQFHMGWEPGANSALNISNIIRDVFGFHLPIEVVFGLEHPINENYSLFVRAAIGPILYVGSLGRILSASGAAGHGTARLWLGMVWRR